MLYRAKYFPLIETFVFSLGFITSILHLTISPQGYLIVTDSIIFSSNLKFLLAREQFSRYSFDYAVNGCYGMTQLGCS